MRKRKTIKIDDREMTIKELRVKDLRKLIENADKSEDIFSNFQEILPSVCDLEFSDLEEMAPSELKTLWEAFQEVNSVFFDLIEKAGIGKLLKESIQKDLIASFAGLSSGGITKH